MFDPVGVDLKKEPSFFLDIKEQVIRVLKDYGRIEKVWVEQNSKGNVWVKFHKDYLEGAKQAKEKLDHIHFDGREISTYYVSENAFAAKLRDA